VLSGQSRPDATRGPGRARRRAPALAPGHAPRLGHRDRPGWASRPARRDPQGPAGWGGGVEAAGAAQLSDRGNGEFLSRRLDNRRPVAPDSDGRTGW